MTVYSLHDMTHRPTVYRTREGPVTFARHNLKAQGITYVNEVISYVHYSQPGCAYIYFGKEQIKRRKTGASNIQADADRCKQTQTVSLVDDMTQSLDNNISPPKLIWSAQPRCWPWPID